MIAHRFRGRNPAIPNSSITLSIRKKLEVARAFKPLCTHKRYKGAYGGRGSGKSHFFAEQLIAQCYSARRRCVCIREVQNSIAESVRQLLIDKIAKFDLGAFFTVLETEIRGKNGSLIVFKGMQAYNSENIKSLEGYDIAWVEEAQNLSETSLRLLRSTIRKAGSELWFSWNPRHETDAVDRFFRGREPRDDAVLVAVTWRDNPWFPDVLKSEKESDYANDPEKADHVWGGNYEIVREALPLTLMGLDVKPIRVGAQQGPAERINAGRALLPLMRFDRTKRVMLGLSRLRRHARRPSVTLGGFAGSLHDINSHGADARRLQATAKVVGRFVPGRPAGRAVGAKDEHLRKLSTPPLGFHFRHVNAASIMDAELRVHSPVRHPGESRDPVNSIMRAAPIA
jgi:Phage terminase large subunit